MKKRVVSMILAAVMVVMMFSVFVLPAAATVASGNLEEKVCWVCDGKLLYIYTGTKSLSPIQMPDKFIQDLNITKSDIKTVVIGGFKDICQEAFKGFTELTSVTILEGMKSIGSAAFQNCTNLTSVVLPEGLTSIGGSAFQSCKNLQNINLPEGLKSIGANAFQGCAKLASVTIPASVTEIGNNAFAGCYSLSKVFFVGTADEWEKIEISETGNSKLKDIEVELHKHTPVAHTTTTYTCSGCNVPLTEELVAKIAEGAENGESGDPAGSILSGGSLAVICSVVCLVVGFVAAMLIFKKKKPATAEE